MGIGVPHSVYPHGEPVLENLVLEEHPAYLVSHPSATRLCFSTICALICPAQCQARGKHPRSVSGMNG